MGASASDSKQVQEIRQELREYEDKFTGLRQDVERKQAEFQRTTKQLLAQSHSAMDSMRSLSGQVQGIETEIEERFKTAADRMSGKLKVMEDTTDEKVQEVEDKLFEVTGHMESRFKDTESMLRGFGIKVEDKIAEMESRADGSVIRLDSKLEAHLAEMDASLSAKLSETDSRVSNKLLDMEGKMESRSKQMEVATKSKFMELKELSDGMDARLVETGRRLEESIPRLDAIVQETEAKIDEQINDIEETMKWKLSELDARMSIETEAKLSDMGRRTEAKVEYMQLMTTAKVQEVEARTGEMDQKLRAKLTETELCVGRLHLEMKQEVVNTKRETRKIQQENKDCFKGITNYLDSVTAIGALFSSMGRVLLAVSNVLFHLCYFPWWSLLHLRRRLLSRCSKVFVRNVSGLDDERRCNGQYSFLSHKGPRFVHTDHPDIQMYWKPECSSPSSQMLQGRVGSGRWHITASCGEGFLEKSIACSCQTERPSPLPAEDGWTCSSYGWAVSVTIDRPIWDGIVDPAFWWLGVLNAIVIAVCVHRYVAPAVDINLLMLEVPCVVWALSLALLVTLQKVQRNGPEMNLYATIVSAFGAPQALQMEFDESVLFILGFMPALLSSLLTYYFTRELMYSTNCDPTFEQATEDVAYCIALSGSGDSICCRVAQESYFTLSTFIAVFVSNAQAGYYAVKYALQMAIGAQMQRGQAKVGVATFIEVDRKLSECALTTMTRTFRFGDDSIGGGALVPTSPSIPASGLSASDSCRSGRMLEDPGPPRPPPPTMALPSAPSDSWQPPSDGGQRTPTPVPSPVGLRSPLGLRSLRAMRETGFRATSEATPSHLAIYLPGTPHSR